MTPSCTDAGISKIGLSRISGVGIASIKELEYAVPDPNPYYSTLDRLAAGLGCPVSALLPELVEPVTP